MGKAIVMRLFKEGEKRVDGVIYQVFAQCYAEANLVKEASMAFPAWYKDEFYLVIIPESRLKVVSPIMPVTAWVRDALEGKEDVELVDFTPSEERFKYYKAFEVYFLNVKERFSKAKELVEKLKKIIGE